MVVVTDTAAATLASMVALKFGAGVDGKFVDRPATSPASKRPYELQWNPDASSLQRLSIRESPVGFVPELNACFTFDPA